jgi:hypothetical protein
MSKLEELQKQAAAQVAQYPQYNGHEQAYVLGRAKRDIKTKMGLCAAAGEIILVKPDEKVIPHGPKAGKMSRTFWSMRNKCATSVPSNWLEFIK